MAGANGKLSTFKGRVEGGLDAELKPLKPPTLLVTLLGGIPRAAALSAVAALPRRDDAGETGHSGPMASARVSALLALAVSVRAKIGRSRHSQADPRDVHRQPALGCTAHPR